MRQCNPVRDHLLVLGLVFGVFAGAAFGQGGPPAWPPAVNDGAGSPPASPNASPTQQGVIASSRSDGPRADAPPPEPRIPLPDDGIRNLMPAPPAPTSPAQAPLPPPGGLQQASYTEQGNAEPPGPKSGAVLGVELLGPTTGSAQQTFSCTLIVKNHSTATILSQVRVELPLPGETRVLLCEPQAEHVGERVSWLVGNLEAGGERRLRVDLLPSQPGEIHLVPHVSYAAAVGLRASIVPPPFALTVSGPQTAALGERVVLAIQLANHTPDPMRLVQICCQLGAGLVHPQGERIETDLANGLAAGEKKTIHLQTEARGTGRLQMQVAATADGHHNASAQHFVTVNEPALSVSADGPRRGLLGHDLAYRVEVANPGKAAAAGVQLRQSLPQGVEFVTASNQASYDPGTQTICWTMGEVVGGARQSVTFQVRAKQIGDWALPAAVTAESMNEVRQTLSVHVEVAPTLALEASAADDPLELGRETTYDVRIFNQAATPAADTYLTVRLPDNVVLVSLDGPTKERGRGQVILFEPMQRLRPNASAVYRLRVRGVKAGTGPVSVEVNASGLPAPVRRELTARVREAR